MQKKIKNLFVGLGPGYHHQVRTMHSMIKEKCDSSMLFFHIEKNVESIGDDLRFHYSMDYKDFPKTFDLFKDFIKEKQFDLIGLGFMSHHWDIYVELSKVIRETLPNCKIIAGGVHAWHISQSDTLEHCDYICAAEGEELYSALVDHLSTKPDVSPISIPGLIEKELGNCGKVSSDTHKWDSGILTHDLYLKYEIDIDCYKLIKAKQAELKDFEKDSATFFEGCLPIEELAKRGVETMRYGPLKPIGLWDPRWGDVNDKDLRRLKRAHAVVQLRQEDKGGRLWNLVGFQTNLKWGEQKRLIRMIPGLSNAEFVRFGVMHRNTFLESPKLIEPTLQFKKRKTLFAAGQLTGTEGYVAAVAGGWLAGTNAALLAKGQKSICLPTSTMIGALTNFVSNSETGTRLKNKKDFQPMPANFGLLPELSKRVHNKRERYEKYRDRALILINQQKKALLEL